MVLLKTLVFTDTKKMKSKTKLHASNSRQRKLYEYQLDKQVYKHQQCVGFTDINRTYRFNRIHRTYRFTDINRTTRFTRTTRSHRFTRINRAYNSRIYRFIRINSAYNFILELTGHIGLGT